VCKVFVGKAEGKRPLGRSKHRWEDVIEQYVRAFYWGVWSGFGWLRVGTSGGLLCSL
jgi:hypothetical protein